MPSKYTNYELRLNSENNPVQVSYPLRFTWKVLEGRQLKYLFEIASDPEFKIIINKIEKYTSDTFYQMDADNHLQTNHLYYYRVKSTSTDNEEADWSTVHTCYIDDNHWDANWITAPNHPNSEKPFTVGTTFQLDKKVKAAYLKITALGLYDAQLNGKKVSADYFRPGLTQYNERLQYQLYDITDQLTDGQNSIDVTVAAGWYAGYYGWDQLKNKFGNATALLAQIDIEYTDGSHGQVITNRNWVEKNNQVEMSDIYQGETIDYGAEEKEVGPACEVDYPVNKLVIQEGPSVRVIKKFTPQSSFVEDGDLVYDMGQNMAGIIQIKLTKPQAGQTIVVKYGETLLKQKEFYNGNLRSAKATDTFKLTADSNLLTTTFTYHGFRYVKVHGIKDESEIAEIHALALSSAHEFLGNMETDNNKINRLQKNIEWSIRSNFFDIPTDCPQRDERLGWTGDAQIIGPTASFLTNTRYFLGKWLKDVAIDQKEKGGAVPIVSPIILRGSFGDGHMHATTGWGDVVTFLPWAIYQAYGDKSILQEQYSSMKAWVNYIMSRGSNPYLWNTDIQLGDWLSLDSPHEGADPCIGATDPAEIATCFFAESARILALSAKILNNMADYIFYHNVHQKIIEEFNQYFLDANKTLKSNTQTANVLALKFGLLSGQAKQVAIQNLVTQLYENNDQLVTGFLGTPFLCEVLIDNGYQGLAYSLLFNEKFPSWLYEVDHGATTIWERWNSVMDDYTMNPDGMNSLNHYAFGSIGLFMYKYLGGIRMRKPGYKETMIYPVLPSEDQINHLLVQYNSVNGLIQNEWTRHHKHFEMKTIIPDNTEGLIVLPQPQHRDELLKSVRDKYSNIKVGLTDKSKIKFMGEWYPLGIDFEREIATFSADAVVLTVPGGTYQFDYELK